MKWSGMVEDVIDRLCRDDLDLIEYLGSIGHLLEKARVSFDMELRDNKTNLSVWRMSYHQDEPVAGKTPADVVAALDKNIERGSRELIAGLDQYFASAPKPAAAGSGK